MLDCLAEGDLHGLYINHCGNNVLRQLIRSLRITTALFDIENQPLRGAKDYNDHLKIVDALECGHPKLVVKAIKRHFKSLLSSAVSL